MDFVWLFAFNELLQLENFKVILGLFFQVMPLHNHCFTLHVYYWRMTPFKTRKEILAIYWFSSELAVLRTWRIKWEFIIEITVLWEFRHVHFIQANYSLIWIWKSQVWQKNDCSLRIRMSLALFYDSGHLFRLRHSSEISWSVPLMFHQYAYILLLNIFL